MDDAHRERMERLKREGARTEGERAMLRRYLDGEPEPQACAPQARAPSRHTPNDQVLDDLIRTLPPTRGARPDAMVEMSVKALRLLIAYARHGDTLRWHRANQAPELSPREALEQSIHVKIAAMAARKELPRLTGPDRQSNSIAQKVLAEKLASTLDRAFVFAEKVQERE